MGDFSNPEKLGFDLGAFVGDLAFEEDSASEDISLEGLQQELEECKSIELRLLPIYYPVVPNLENMLKGRKQSKEGRIGFNSEKTNMETLPDDVLREIIFCLPSQDLVKLTLVSKKFLSLIRDKLFRNQYIGRSTTRPRLLFSSGYFLWKPEVLFHSIYQEEKPLLSSSGQQKALILHNHSPYLRIDHPTRGLICLQDNTKVAIANPGAKKLRTLPKIQAGQEGAMRSYLGYDEDTDVFKVLCVPVPNSMSDTPKEARECQVLTYGSGEEYWRRIKCKHHHSPVTRGICKGGVLYYGALSNGDRKSLVMSFNVRSEEFTLTELPEGANIHRDWYFVNYNGNIAIVEESRKDVAGRVIAQNPNGNGVLEMRVMNETAGNWWTKRIEIPRWREILGDSVNYYFKGTTGTGELVFAPNMSKLEPLSVLYYDTVTQNHRRVQIEGVDEYFFNYIQTFMDHIDSSWLI